MSTSKHHYGVTLWDLTQLASLSIVAKFYSFVNQRTKTQIFSSILAMFLGVGIISTKQNQWSKTKKVLFAIVVWILTKTVLLRRISSHQRTIETRNKSVLVTGCDKGIGEFVVRDLHARGFQVFAGCLSQQKVDAYAAEFASAQVTPLLLDVTKSEDIEAARERVEKEVGRRGLYGLVNNAGVLTLAPVDWLELKDFRFNMEVNYFGTVSMTKAFLPLLARGAGRVTNVASIAGHITLPCFAAYAASKHAVVSFSNACRAEFRDLGVTVITIEPGVLSTGMAVDFTDSFDRVWTSLLHQKQTGYGDTYRSVLRGRLSELLDTGENPQLAVNAIAEALVVGVPRSTYRVGTNSEISVWISRFQFMLDALLSYHSPPATLNDRSLTF